MKTGSTHVLIAEDDDDDFQIFSSAISDLSFEILLSRVEDGKVLIQFLDNTIPDILFLDILLPYKDGRACIREIRANKKFDELPIIAYSSIKHVETTEFFYREGANLFVIKPSSFKELKDVLQKILSIEWKKTMYYPPKSQFVMNPNTF
jgi:DNA-binding response OmpR family regulator